MGLESFKLADLSGNGAKAEQFRAALKRDHVAIVELPSCHRPAIANMWSYAEDFFHLPKSTRETMGPLFEPEYSERHLGQGRLTGFTQKAFNDCLDTRLRRCSSSSGAAMRGDLEILPRELEESLPGATQAMLEAERVLFDLGLSALRIVCEELNADPLLGMPVTPEGICSSSEDLSEGATSATVHRLVRYAAAGGLQGIQRVLGSVRAGGSFTSDVDGDPSIPKADLAFPAHTDGTWFTIIPCAAQPGLEVRAASGWVPLEEHARHGLDVAVLSGEYLQGLSRREYLAASHRVVRPKEGDPARLSAPLLMRAAPEYRDMCKNAGR